MFSIRNIAVASAALLAPLSVAQAATLVQTSVIDRQTTDIHTGPTWLDGFDSSLGTLTGVEISYGFGLDSEGQFINRGRTDANFQFKVDYLAYFTFDGPSTIADSYLLDFTTGMLSYSGLAVGDEIAFGPYSFENQGTITPLDISQFIDTDFSYALDTLTSNSLYGGGGNISYGLRTYGEGFVEVVYTYDEAVPGIPEPASWALLILGFGAVGSTMRRRKPATMKAVCA